MVLFELQKTWTTSPAPKTYLYDDGTISLHKSSSRKAGIFWPLTNIANRLNNTFLQVRDGLTEEQRAEKVKKEEKGQILTLRMKNAETLEEWADAAKELDILENNEAWKYELFSSEFDFNLVQERLKQLDVARTNCDIKKMMGLVRMALSRDLGGMGDIKLYKHSHIGTKQLIERYIDSTIDTIRSLVETSKFSMPEGLETKDILEQVLYARQAFGRSALLLSGGATFGMNHVGVLKALFEAKLMPRIISGTSAGSIVCAVLCTRTDEEIPDVLKEFPYGDLAVFEEQGNEEGILDRIRRLLTQGAWIDIKHLIRVMQELLGDMTFQESYNRSRRILNITVSSASVYELPRLLNYITSPNVMIWSAVVASCSIPVLFSAAQLLVKNPVTGENSPWNPTPQRWIDGSVDNDLPMTRLAEMFNVNHFIVSQVNPHVVPFLAKDDAAIAANAQSDGATGPGLIYFLTNLAKDEALHRMHMLADLGIFPNLVTKARSVLSQKYSGDITILPEIDYKDIPRILKNPTAEFMIQTCLSGERATWPKLSRIRNRCAVELELDAAVQALRARVVFSPSQVDLRRMTTGSVRGSVRRHSMRRRGSGSTVHTFQPPGNNEDDDEIVHNLEMTTSKMPPRTKSTTHIMRRYIPPLVRNPGFNPPQSGKEPFASSNPSTKKGDFMLQIPDSSAGETAPSAPSSDADIDSHTDESTPDPDEIVSPRRGGPSLNICLPVDYFSSSQPVTSGFDHILATSPLTAKSNLPALQSPRTPKVEESRRRSFTASSTAEMKTKRVFHSSLGGDPKASY